MSDKFIEDLFNRLGDKVNIDTKVSYTAKLINEPELLAKKNWRRNNWTYYRFYKK